MSQRTAMKEAIQSTIIAMMERVMDRVLVSDPFIVEEHHNIKPLYAALVPDEIFKGSHFERRFVTPFGSVWETLAVQVATHAGGRAQKGHTITGPVDTERLRRIQETLNKLEHQERGQSRTRPNWSQEIEYILQGKSGKIVSTTIVCDVYVEFTKSSKRFAFELKAPLPNSDQTKVSKEKILKLFAMEPRQIDFAYFALPYNPYGRKIDYAWSFPKRWFDITNDEPVLIGEEFWDLIGGTGTYKDFINAINEIGPGYRDRIYREFLGIEPPKNSADDSALR